mmetsp:Transcript_21923/g.28404  ORF Transcript_21923/g.28404 Transcript_21923/m.28404 type:complete len:512 (+) Transcript_21923:173-1708(+)
MGGVGGKLKSELDPPVDKDQKLSDAHPDFKGPTEKRKCTDILPLLLLIAVWVCMTGMGIDSCTKGEPYILWAPMDSNGQFCGFDANVTDRPYLYYIGTDLSGACVESCPTEYVMPTSASDLICKDGYRTTGNYPHKDLLLKDYCSVQYPTTPRLKRCIFDNETLASFYDTSEYTSAIQEFFTDIYVARAYTFGLGFALALVIGFVYCFLLRLPGVLVTLVWGSIVLIGLSFLGAAAWMLQLAEDWSSADPQVYEDYEINFVKAVGWLCIIFLVIYICVIFFLRKRINLAMGVVKESCKALADMPLIVVFPLIQLCGFIVFMVFWVLYVVYLAGTAEVSESSKTTEGYTTRELTYSSDAKKRGWYFLFCYFWTSEFILALGQIVLALCFAKWYFQKGDTRKLGSSVLFTCIRQGMFYHMGTAAFGSLIIAVIKMIRAMLAYLQKKVQASGTPASKFLKPVFCCIQCCLWCFEKCMKFLNKNAYIQTAIFSYSFCKAAKEAFFLLLRNIARVS